MALDDQVAAVDHQLRALLDAGVDQPGDLLVVALGDQRAHVGRRVGARADRQLLDPLADLVHQRLGDVADRDGDRHGHAALPGGAEGGRDEAVGGEIEVGVGEHDRVVLGPAERLHALAVGGARLEDVLRDRRGADERDRGDAGVLEDGVDRLLVAVDDARTRPRGARPRPTARRARMLAGRVLLGRLEDERVAAGDRHGRHPQRDHHREVERRDAGDDAERLRIECESMPPETCGVISPLSRCAEPARELDDLQPARDLAARVGEHLAVLARDDRGQLVLVRVEQLAEREQDLRALGERRGAPLGAGGRGGLHGAIDVGGRRERNARDDLAGGGIGHLADDARRGARRAARRSSG